MKVTDLKSAGHTDCISVGPQFARLYCIVFLFSPNIIHMTVDSSVCNIF